MSEVDFQGALNELQSGSETAESAEAQGEQQVQQELYELPVGDGQTIKLPMNTELPIKHNGEMQNVPLEKLFNIYRQSTHLGSKAEELKALRAKVESERGDLDSYNQLKEKYSAIQDWSEKNPQQWERLYQMFQDRETLLTGQQAYGTDMQDGSSTGTLSQDPRLSYEFQAMNSKLEALTSQLDEYKQREEQQQEQQDVAQIEQEITDFQKQYPNVDLAEKDMDDMSLKARIIKHGLDNGYPDFRSAALTFPGLLDRLVDTAKKTGISEAAKRVQQDTKNGVVGRSSTPFSGQGADVDPTKVSEEKLVAMAKAELEDRLKEVR